MISASQALASILTHAKPLPSQRVPLLQSLNHVAAEAVFASVAYPGFDQSSMDGYAIRASDSHSAQPLRVVGEQPAGKKLSLALRAGEAIRIFTGAPLPQGADAVIMQEDVDRVNPHEIRCQEPVVTLENVRLTGSEVALGQKGISAGSRITPASIAWLAAQGLTSIDVVSSPRIAIIATGDELIPPGSALMEGQIYESNSFMLAAMCQSLGFHDLELHHCPDQLSSTAELIDQLRHRFDVLLFSGGVSVGDHDHVKPALLQAGFTTEFWRVAIKPGKPLIFATHAGPDHNCLAFGLPGNPVSAWVTFALFVKPALRQLAGHCASSESHTTYPLATAIPNPERRDHYVRGILVNGQAKPMGAQVSHGLQGLSLASHLIRIPAESKLQAGEEVEVLPIL